MPQVTILTQSCKGVEDCGICIKVCPKDLFEPGGDMNQAGYVPPRITDMDECIGCENCMIYCPDMAIIVAEDEKKGAVS